MLDALATIGRRSGTVATGLLVVALLVLGGLVGVPTLLGFQTYAITTGSMTGTADPGSLVIADEVPVDDLAVGDVITYLPPEDSGLDQLVTHRLVEIDVQADGTRLMRTQGDANATPDPWTFVLDGHVQPRMRAALPHAGLPVLAMADRSVRIGAIGVPAAIIALLSLAEIVKVLRDPSEDERGAEVAAPATTAPPTAAPDELAATAATAATAAARAARVAVRQLDEKTAADDVQPRLASNA